VAEPGSAGLDAEVLVIGFGPVGCVLAALLAERGLEVVVVDRDTDLFPLPRAAHFDHEIMRVVQELGCSDEIAPSLYANPGMDFLNADRQVLMSMRSGSRTLSGWPSSNMFHQPGFERALRSRAAAFGADIRLGVEVTGIEQHADHVAASTADGGTIRAAWVVACDGARSSIRKQSGIDMDDLRFEEPWLVLDLVLHDGVAPPSPHALQVCDPARPHTLVPMPAPRYRFEFMLLPGEDASWIQQPAVIDELLSAWMDPTTATVERSAVYTFHGLIAEQWRQGRMLLAGDAAHQMPPFLGQGMCSGIRDAANLAWKLDQILRRGVDNSILDSYQAEREPHVRAIVEAAVGFGRIICTTDPDIAAARDAGMLAARAAERAGGAPDAEPAHDGSPTPPLTPGALVGDGGGALSLQVSIDGTRSDDVIGQRFAVVARSASLLASSEAEAWATIGAVLLDAEAHPGLGTLLDVARGDVAVIRPDRYLYAVAAHCPPPPPVLMPASSMPSS
jgi:3-(3-hydroxy-phenyl)propionate hydroxylase